MARPRIYGFKERSKMRELFSIGLTPPRIAYVIGCNHMTVYRELGMEPMERRLHRTKRKSDILTPS